MADGMSAARKNTMPMAKAMNVASQDRNVLMRVGCAGPRHCRQR